MLTVGSQFPQFSVKAAVKNDHTPDDFPVIDNKTYSSKWLCVFFWPKDFTFVCPTEIAAFGKMAGDFANRDCQILGGSTDNEFVHMAWRNSHEDLKTLPIPMFAAGKLASELGILDVNENVCLRATFLVDPEGVIRYASVNDLSVGRNPAEVMRVLDALQTDELCPCNWKKGDATLQAA